jgi:hypothetical protein
MASSTTTFAMSCLSEQHQAVLDGVSIGNFLIFQYAPPPPAQPPQHSSDVHEDGDDQGSNVDASEDPVNAQSDGEDAEEPPTSVQGDTESNDNVSGDEEDDQDEETEPTSDEDNEPPAMISRTNIFVVSNVITDEAGEVTDLELVEMHYALQRPANSQKHKFQVYGQLVNPAIGHDDACFCEQDTRLTDIDEKYDLSKYMISKNVNGDYIRHHVLRNRCPANCNHGFLPDIKALRNVVEPSVFAPQSTLEHRPICPVCVGIDVLVEQQDLRTTLEAFTQVDLGAAHTFHANMSTRRTALGYHYIQFDEREWGYMFDDMLEESEDDDDGANHNPNDGYQYWEEAMDPNANPTQRPADEAAIAALPRKVYAEIRDPNMPAQECSFTKEVIPDDAMVIQLPCGHIFNEECITQWLGMYNNCPVDRIPIPAAEDSTSVKAEAHLAEDGMASVEEEEMAGATFHA